jgi:23S rRNA (adenine2030-N6)-methyltransferase
LLAYRHLFHAGNFADVFKHAVLARILVHLCEKPQAFRVLDTHAGAGVYNLEGARASRTGEWRDGIGRLLQRPPEGAAGELLAPYLASVSSLNPGGALKRYPGSPQLALSLMREQDRLTACELEPKAATALANHLRKDRRARVVEADGWQALNAHLPPSERRGLVVVDPPYEAADDLDRLEKGLLLAQRKWATGIYLLWYPIKGAGSAAFLRRMQKLAIPKVLRTELHVKAATSGSFTGSGLIIVNPPWRLAQELKVLLPALHSILSQGRGSRTVLDPANDNF